MNNKIVATFSSGAYLAYMTEDKKRFSEYMKNFYAEGIDNPCVSHMIMHDVFCKYGNDDLNNEQNTKLDKTVFDLNNSIKRLMSLSTYELPHDKNSEPSVLSYKADFINEYRCKYPKTFNVRNNLIMMRQIRPNVVTEKSDWRTKIKAGLIGKSYSEVYPKTLKLREFLLDNNKIIENEVTPKFSWLKKFLFLKKLK